MAYVQLENFLGHGNEKLVWILSLKNVGGIAAGLLLGQRIGELIFGSGFLPIATALVCAAIGWILTISYHGMPILRRIGLLAHFWTRRLLHSPDVDGLQYVADGTAESGWGDRVRHRIAPAASMEPPV